MLIEKISGDNKKQVKAKKRFRIVLPYSWWECSNEIKPLIIHIYRNGNTSPIL